MKKIIAILLIILTCGCTKNINYDKYLKLTNIYSHNENSFTEGLFFYQDKLYETSGLYEKSKIYKDINFSNGTARQEKNIDDEIFAEGSVIYKNKLYVLTYKENKILEYNKDTLELLNTYYYPNEGWGLTTNNKYLIASDGSSNIYYINEKMEINKIITVKDNNKKVKNINELEYINDYIWANVWKENIVLIINPSTGNVIKKIDFTSLINKYIKSKNVDVLNGIAFNKNKIYITGKYYPYIFEFKIK